MKLTGTITNSDGSYGYIDVEADTYEEARGNLYARLEDGQKLITIRTDR
ncbi:MULTISPECIES: hypothetical protein [Arthrobacter]|nr:hypothetical protein [Arthrobacter globiformis]